MSLQRLDVDDQHGSARSSRDGDVHREVVARGATHGVRRGCEPGTRPHGAHARTHRPPARLAEGGRAESREGGGARFWFTVPAGRG